MQDYQRIREYLDHVSGAYNLNICIKDYVGFIPINQSLDHVLSPYVAHTNPYCMFVKQDRKRYYKCLSMIRPMYNCCLAGDDGFWGICHAGVYESVVPIKLSGEVLGSINVGCFPGKEKESSFLIRRLFAQADAGDYEKAMALFEAHMQPASVDPDTMLPMLRLLSEYLAQTYTSFKNSQSGKDVYRLPRENCEDTILSHAIEYIRQNYASKITVKQIAQSCHCCESYINHTFRKRTGVNINVYINKTRIEHAKNYLLTTAMSISEIAMTTGFSDPNYFSRVFMELLGITPTEFRRRYTT